MGDVEEAEPDRPARPSDRAASRAIRVLHVVRSLETGGLERLVCDLVAERGAATTSVACLTTLGPLGEALRAQGVSVTVVGMDGGPARTLARLHACIRSEGPDVIHCHNLLSHLYGSLVARLGRTVGVVLTKHGSHLPPPSLSMSLNRWLIHRSRVVAVSEEIRDLMARWVPSGSPEVAYIANGISLGPYASLPDRIEARRRCGWSETDYLIGTVARLSPSKDHGTLLAAFAALRHHDHDARLILVGDGPLRASILSDLERLGLSDSVEWLGDRRDVPAILAALDLFALSSQSEGIPMTILEAMAARLPVAATTVGGIPQVVSHGETGLLVPPRSPEALAEAMLRMRREPELASRMGCAGRRRVENDFDLRRVVERYEAVYLSLLTKRAQRSQTE